MGLIVYFFRELISNVNVSFIVFVTLVKSAIQHQHFNKELPHRLTVNTQAERKRFRYATPGRSSPGLLTVSH